jgi:polyhydroxyalkanoate synthesis regulator phasin
MDLFRNAFLAGLGALSLSRERVKALVDELVAEGKVKEKEGGKLVDEMMKKAEATRKDVEKTVREQAQNAYAHLNLATQDQLKRLEAQIRQMEASLAKSAPRPVKKAAKAAPKAGAKKSTKRNL